jgi:hypothetical protein
LSPAEKKILVAINHVTKGESKNAVQAKNRRYTYFEHENVNFMQFKFKMCSLITYTIIYDTDSLYV